MLITNGISFAQSSKIKLDEYFFGVNYSNPFKLNTYENQGMFGFDLGLKNIFNKEKRFSFNHGLEFSNHNYFFNKLQPRDTKGFYYKDLQVNSFSLINSLNARFHFDKSKKFFFETGLNLNWNFKHVEGERVNYLYQIDTYAYKSTFNNYFSLGLNLGFAYSFLIKQTHISLKPELSFVPIPYLFNSDSYYFENFSFARFVIIFRNK